MRHLKIIDYKDVEFYPQKRERPVTVMPEM